jgi:hypothetical protein
VESAANQSPAAIPLLNREITGNFVVSGTKRVPSALKNPAGAKAFPINSLLCGTGNNFDGTGNFPGLTGNPIGLREKCAAVDLGVSHLRH